MHLINSTPNTALPETSQAITDRAYTFFKRVISMLLIHDIETLTSTNECNTANKETYSRYDTADTNARTSSMLTLSVNIERILLLLTLLTQLSSHCGCSLINRRSSILFSSFETETSAIQSSNEPTRCNMSFTEHSSVDTPEASTLPATLISDSLSSI